jgi:hypothetical protein
MSMTHYQAASAIMCKFARLLPALRARCRLTRLSVDPESAAWSKRRAEARSYWRASRRRTVAGTRPFRARAFRDARQETFANL